MSEFPLTSYCSSLSTLQQTLEVVDRVFSVPCANDMGTALKLGFQLKLQGIHFTDTQDLLGLVHALLTANYLEGTEGSVTVSGLEVTEELRAALCPTPEKVLEYIRWYRIELQESLPQDWFNELEPFGKQLLLLSEKGLCLTSPGILNLQGFVQTLANQKIIDVRSRSGKVYFRPSNVGEVVVINSKQGVLEA